MESKIRFTPEGLGSRSTHVISSAYVRGAGANMVRVLDDDGTLLGDAPEIVAEDLLSMYEWMLRVRAFDERLVKLQRQGRVGFFVPSTGEEALQIGTAWALRPDDWVFPAYREQGVALFRGYPVEAILAQLMGNDRDYLKGRQMPNHFGCPRYRFAVASSPVGTQIPHAVGAAWSARIRREESVAAVYFGDGATSTGDFHAGMNFAAVQQLPVVFFCKNNGWAISLPRAKQTRAEFLTDRAIGYGMPGVRVDGNDILAVNQVAQEAMEWARSGSGPVFVEMVTQRMGPHSTADDPTRYRDPELIEPWKKKDPLIRMRRYLESRNLWSDGDEQRAAADSDARLTAAIEAAEAGLPPEPETMFEDVYAELPWHLREQQADFLES
ncbi:MAG: 3-methyl-2-oxobutanoate dehydrogenase [Armatimonadetes bacterium]|nr:3-methyl-2-oxobutanoate dehydrogenase [Armatimonadota bacterium]